MRRSKTSAPLHDASTDGLRPSRPSGERQLKSHAAGVMAFQLPLFARLDIARLVRDTSKRHRECAANLRKSA